MAPSENEFDTPVLGGQEGRERNINAREKHRLVASPTHPDRGLNLQLGTCLDQESNLQPIGYRKTLQPTEPHRPGQYKFYIKITSNFLWFQLKVELGFICAEHALLKSVCLRKETLHR